MKNEMLQQVLKSIQENGFALIIPEPDQKQHRAYTVGLFANENLNCELVFTETHSQKMCNTLICKVIDLASTGELLLDVRYEIKGARFTIKRYETWEYMRHPLTRANEFFNVGVPVFKIVCS